MLPVIGILYGDAAGIGPEQIARLCADRCFEGKCRPIIIGDARVLKQGFDIIGKECEINLISQPDDAAFGEAVDVLNLNDLSPNEYELGTVNVKCGESAYQAMKCAMDLLLEEKISGLLYAPQNKTSFAAAGHELDSMDFMCKYLKVERYGELNVLDKVCTARVTSHIPLRLVSTALTSDKILDTILFAYDSMIAIGRRNCKIAVMGLNPHNGENGLCGNEELDVISPAVNRAKELGIKVYGPFSPDTLFIRAFKGDFDTVVTMYHDQGQIAMKLMGFSSIVTVIGGPRWPIATPAHGTAFDIAGKGIADMGAIKHALDIVCEGASINRPDEIGE